jgi:ABC-type bacteriocin/lantibiotic exporter with double-glycine peptidase domain
MYLNYKNFFNYIFKTYKYKSLKIFFISIIETLLEVFSIAVLIGVLIATLGQGNEENELIKTLNNFTAFKSLENANLFYLVITIYLIKNVILVVINWLKLDLCGQIYRGLSESTYKILLKKNNLFFSNYSSGHLAQNVMGESQFTKDVMMSFVTLFTEILIITFMLLLIISQKPFVGFFTVFCIIIASTFYYFFMKKKNIYLGERRQSSSIAIMNLLFQSIAAHKLIILRNKINYFLNKFTTQIDTIYKVSRDQGTIQYSAHLWLESCVLLILIFSLAPLLSETSRLNQIASEVILITIISLRFIPSFSTILNSYSTIQFGQKAVINILEILKSKDYIDDDKLIVENFSINNLSLKSVSFKYDGNDNYILKDFNFTTKNHSLIGIRGKNGSGKSTLLNIIAGLMKPQSGQLILNDVPLYENSQLHFNWKKTIGYVDQKFFFTNDSILKNVAFGEDDSQINIKKVEECLEKVNLLSFFKTKKEGLNISIGENGVKLSGGQLQRINIARALYSEPKILILDEATNNLDTESQRDLLNLLIFLKKTSLIFIATHSDFLLKECDNIITL